LTDRHVYCKKDTQLSTNIFFFYRHIFLKGGRKGGKEGRREKERRQEEDRGGGRGRDRGSERGERVRATARESERHGVRESKSERSVLAASSCGSNVCVCMRACGRVYI